MQNKPQWHIATPVLEQLKKQKQTLTIPSADNDVEKLWLSDILCGHEKQYNRVEKLTVSPNIERSFSIQSRNTIPPLGIYPREIQSNAHTKTYIKKFIGALFITARKQTNELQLVNGWRNIHTME